jgi:integrase
MKSNTKSQVPSINIYIESNAEVKSQKRSLFFRVRLAGKTFRIPTGQKLDPKFWDNENKRVKKSYTGSLELNQMLKHQEEKIWKVWREFQSKDNFKIPDFKEACTKELHGKITINDNQFFEEYENYKTSLQDIRRHPRTIQKYGTLKTLLEAYQTKSGNQLTFDSFDMEFYDKFVSFLFGRKQTNNTVGKYISSLKTFLRWAEEKGLLSNYYYKKYTVFDEESNISHLEPEELMKLLHKDLSFNPELDHVRDFICFECFTGQRYSDVANLEWSDIDFVNKTWTLNVIKTKTRNKIPLTSYALSILEKNKNRQPKPFALTNHQVNNRIKEIAELLGLTDEIRIVRFQGSERIEKVFQKFEKIASHIGRRTFVILSIENGMHPEAIKAITGHKTDKAFKKYVKITDTTKSREMEKAWGAQIFQLKSVS